MRIKAIVVEGPKCTAEITATATGVCVTVDHEIIAEYPRGEDETTRYEHAEVVAAALYGRARGGHPNATNSMVHAVLAEMDRVAAG